MAACEDPILDIGLRNNVKIYDRAPETLHEKVPVEVARKFVWEIEAEYFIEVTACTPFLKPSTIDAAVDYMFNSNIKSLFSIVPRKNFFFDNNSFNFIFRFSSCILSCFFISWCMSRKLSCR